MNVINEQIPTTKHSGYRGGFVADFGTGAREGGAAGDMQWGNNRWALHAGGTAHGNGDVRTPAFVPLATKAVASCSAHDQASPATWLAAALRIAGGKA